MRKTDAIEVMICEFAVVVVAIMEVLLMRKLQIYLGTT